MNMPVLPAVQASQPPADTSVRATDAGAPQDTPAFSNVLSSQRGAAPGDKAPATTGRADAAHVEAGKKQDPLGPDETLALILDSAALPLMQAVAQTPVAARHQIGTARTGDDTAANTPVSARREADTAALLANADADAPLDAADAAPASRPARNTAASGLTLPAAAAQVQADAPVAEQDRRPTIGKHANTPLSAAADGKTALAATVAAATAADPAVRPQAAPLVAAQDAPAIAAAAPLGATLLPAAASASTPAPIQLTVPTPLSSPQWPQDFSRQVLNLTQSGAATGHIVTMHVNPPELGPIHITLHLGDALTQASFVSPHANVRQALENALPHLEQQLAQAGLSLGQANVSDQQPGQQQFGQPSPNASSADGAVFSLDGDMTAPATTAPASAARPASRPDALVDTFV